MYYIQSKLDGSLPLEEQDGQKVNASYQTEEATNNFKLAPNRSFERAKQETWMAVIYCYITIVKVGHNLYLTKMNTVNSGY